MKENENQLKRKLLGTIGLNFTVGYDSSSRQQMLSSQLGQLLVIEGSTERRIQTGLEREFGKYTFSVKLPTDATVIKVINLYNQNYGQDPINYNPLTIVIYEDNNSREYGLLEIPNYCSYHQHFGFNYKPTPEMGRLKRGACFKEGTILMDSPSINSTGGYQYGRECNVAFMSHPGIAEDGVIISRDVLEKFAYSRYETRVIEFGKNHFPLFIYGDGKIFPEIGEYIREDGILMALRGYDPVMSVTEQHKEALSIIDTAFDKLIYGAGPGGRVIDIRVEHDTNSVVPTTPFGMDDQALKYDVARRAFYQDIINTYRQIVQTRGENIVLTPEFNRYIVEAIAVCGESAYYGNNRGNSRDPKVVKEYRRAPLDDWRITITLEYRVVPSTGQKLSCCHG